jgi:hypothetical protein
MRNLLTNTRFSIILLTVCILFFNWGSFAQSPKKLLANGYYEQAFLDATKKQNKKVKLKKKHTSVIFKSFDLIYEKGTGIISSSSYDWKTSYEQLIRVVSFRSKVKHPGVYDKLKNILYDENVLGNVSSKFNQENKLDLDQAASFENEEKYTKALEIYQQIKLRQEQSITITTLKNRIEAIDIDDKLNHVNKKIGDQYIEQAKQHLYNGTQKDAKDAIELIKKARSHRLLDQEEEELLTLANLIIKDSWMQEAKELLKTNTKRNGRLAYELIKKARSLKGLSSEEELLSKQALAMGMTNVRLIVKGKNGIHTAKNLAGILNKERLSEWITYYDMDSELKMDFDFELTEVKPKTVLEDIRKRIEQRTKTVEYYEEQTNSAGEIVKVKKTKNVHAFVAIFSRTKYSTLEWTVSLIDKIDGKIIYTESNVSRVEKVNEFASLESGDILALPENIETEISLDSQPFPTDKQMDDLVTRLYLKELSKFLKSKKDHLLNIDLIQQ